MHTNQLIYLASGSPRRKELMDAAEIPCKQLNIDVEEIYSKELPVEEVPIYLAKLKAREALKLISKGIVITADTVVISHGNILGKPKDADDAAQMLATLSDDQHHVLTGVCLYSNEKKISFSNLSKVYLHPLTESEINQYIKEYQPFDKAGSYGIQEWFGWAKIYRIEGSYANVMGLPIDEVYHRLIKSFGYSPSRR
jgi:septum formation protein